MPKILISKKMILSILETLIKKLDKVKASLDLQLFYLL